MVSLLQGALSRPVHPSHAAMQCCHRADAEQISEVFVLANETVAASLIDGPGYVLLWASETPPKSLLLSYKIRRALITKSLSLRAPVQPSVQPSSFAVCGADFEWLCQLQTAWQDTIQQLSLDLSMDPCFSSSELSVQACGLALRSRSYVLTATADQVLLHHPHSEQPAALQIDHQLLQLTWAGQQWHRLAQWVEHALDLQCAPSRSWQLLDAQWPEAALPQCATRLPQEHMELLSQLRGPGLRGQQALHQAITEVQKLLDANNVLCWVSDVPAVAAQTDSTP